MDTRIAISVGDKDRAVRRNGGAGRVIERRLPFWLMPVADAQEPLAGEIEDDNLMGVAIGDPHAIPSVDRDSMRIEDFARAIRSDEGSIRFVNDDRRLSAAEDMDPPRRFYGDLANASRQEIGRHATEVTLHRVSPAAQGYVADFSAPGHGACSR